LLSLGQAIAAVRGTVSSAASTAAATRAHLEALFEAMSDNPLCSRENLSLRAIGQSALWECHTIVTRKCGRILENSHAGDELYLDQLLRQSERRRHQYSAGDPGLFCPIG
jgi:hypothetical protein